VKDRDSTQIYLLANNAYLSKSPQYLSPKQKVRKFEGYADRPDITTHSHCDCNQSRFENINKNPEILTRTKRVPNIEFKKGTARNSIHSTPNSMGGSFYD
jgi:hypothetical protein